MPNCGQGWVWNVFNVLIEGSIISRFPFQFNSCSYISLNDLKFEISEIFWGGAHRTTSPDPSPISSLSINSRCASKSQPLRASPDSYPQFWLGVAPWIRDVRPRGLASASRPKNLASASASASWVVASASASASWVLASASWVLASSLEAFRGQQPKRNGMWLELVNHHAFPEVSHAAAIRKLVSHLAWKHSFIILNTRQPNL